MGVNPWRYLAHSVPCHTLFALQVRADVLAMDVLRRARGLQQLPAGAGPLPPAAAKHWRVEDARFDQEAHATPELREAVLRRILVVLQVQRTKRGCEASMRGKHSPTVQVLGGGFRR